MKLFRSKQERIDQEKRQIIEQAQTQARELLESIRTDTDLQLDHLNRRRLEVSASFTAEIEAYEKRIHEQRFANTLLEKEASHEASMLTARRDELRHERQRVEREIEKLRQGAPDQLWDNAFASGYAKAFDIVADLQEQGFQTIMDKKIREAVARENARFETILATHRTREHHSDSPAALALYDEIAVKLDRARKAGSEQEVKLLEAQHQVLSRLVGDAASRPAASSSTSGR